MITQIGDIIMKKTLKKIISIVLCTCLALQLNICPLDDTDISTPQNPLGFIDWIDDKE